MLTFRPNSYAGPCRICQQHVPAGAGSVSRAGSRFVLRCAKHTAQLTSGRASTHATSHARELAAAPRDLREAIDRGEAVAEARAAARLHALRKGAA
jgi:hypothetical protein